MTRSSADGASALTAPAPSAPATFAALLRRAEFRRLWLAGVQSMLGDQVARVALSVLVFDRTRSGLATAGVYALTYLPAFVGTTLLSPLADRLPRRRVLVAGDLARAALVAVMAVPAVPLAVVAVLLVASVAVGAPWKAAESALVIDILDERDYPLGVGLRTATLQAAQLIGFAVGGVAVALIGAHAALAVNAVTFLISAVVLRFGVRFRPAAASIAPRVDRPGRWLDGARAVLADATLRRLLQFSWLLGLLVVPEGVAAPYAAQLGGGARTVGLLLSAGPAGVLVGTVIFARVVRPAARAQLLGPLSVAAGLPLLAFAWTPTPAVSAVALAVSGMCTAYQVQVVTEFARAISPSLRAQGIGLASAGLLAAQGIGLILGGGLAQLASASTAVACAGGVTAVLALGLSALRHRRV